MIYLMLFYHLYILYFIVYTVFYTVNRSGIDLNKDDIYIVLSFRVFFFIDSPASFSQRVYFGNNWHNTLLANVLTPHVAKTTQITMYLKDGQVLVFRGGRREGYDICMFHMKWLYLSFAKYLNIWRIIEWDHLNICLFYFSWSHLALKIRGLADSYQDSGQEIQWQFIREIRFWFSVDISNILCSCRD